MSDSNVYPWHDEHYINNKVRPDPRAVAARTLELADWLQSEAREQGENEGWIGYGLAAAAASLARNGDFNALGLLLTGLEELVPADDRARWPLHQVIADQYATQTPTNLMQH